MSNIQGFVSSIDVKETSVGKMYDLNINGKRYGMGKFPPKEIAAGDYVSFTPAQRGNFWNVQAGTLSKLDKPAGVSPPAPVSAPAYGGGDRRQETISKQAALNTSLTFVKLLSDNGALPMPGKVAADKKADLIKDIVLLYTAEFYKLSTGETYDLPETGPMDLASVEEAGTWQE